MDGAPKQDMILHAFLAERDAACPRCGYNLRGTQCDLCPECGGPIELTIAGRSARERWWALVACFSALCLLAGIEAARAGQAAHTEAVATAWATFSTAGRTQRIAITPPRSPGSISVRANVLLLQRSATGGSRLTLRGGPPAAIDWSRVSWWTWARLGWWGALGLVGLAGLTMVLALRRRGREPDRRIAVFAGASIALFVGAQTFVFLREIV